MAGKPGYIHKWDVGFNPKRRHYKLRQNVNPPLETITYESDVRKFKKILRRNKRLDKMMKRKAYDIKAQIAARLPESDDKSRRKRANLKQLMAVRRVNPGGVFEDRMSYEIYDTSSGASMGRVRLVDWLSQYSDEDVRSRVRGKEIGSPIRPRITTRAMRSVARGKTRG